MRLSPDDVPRWRRYGLLLANGEGEREDLPYNAEVHAKNVKNREWGASFKDLGVRTRFSLFIVRPAVVQSAPGMLIGERGERKL